jgi:elongator complex protein 1
MTPPPMSHSEIKFDDPVVAISINKSMAVLTCKSIELVSNIDLKSKDLVKVTIGSFENGRLIEMINDKEFLVVEFRNGSDVLVHVCLDQNGTLTRNDIHIEDDLFESMIGFPKPAIQTKSGTVYELRKVDGSFLPIQKTTFPTVCQVFQACEMMFANHSETVYVGLDKRNKCYLNHHLLASNVTSIYVQSEFLLMTNLEHQCLFIPLHQLVESLDQVEPGQGVERSRRIEQGAQIVTVAGMNVVLIMPRGNIETIAPRPLVLSYIRKCIDQKEYRNAFIACRKHRVDLNYLIDVDLETFLTNVHVFVEQVDVDDWLNLVIGGLKDDSTAEFKTASKVLTRSGEQQVNEDRLGSGVKRYMKQKESSAKTNRVCEAMRTVLPPSRVQPILTTFAKQVPPKLEDALRCITLMNKELQKDALTYLIFLVDVETLYKTALGMYDFPVALMVAQQSKMDPREYLPYLQSLNVLPESEKKYQVDHDLDRFDNAVGHLVKYSSVEGVMVYVKEHQLYNVAMDLYEFGTDGYIKLANLCGEWMVDEQEYRNAGAVFEQIGNMERAIDVYTLGLFWKEAMRLASLVGRIDDVKKVLVEGLVESKRWSEAAQVCDLGGDVKGAISMYALARDYDSALYLCAKHQSSPTETLSNLKSYSETIVTNLTNKNQVFIKEFEQLQKIRMEKLTGTFVIRQAVEDIEMLDDTASMATTRVTGRTFLTSRTGYD